ncbi:hypothetical protein GS3922_11550 [Geobacillus subterraneus]|uniref:Carbohydrate kinase FGGY N-terminal domain-containing protein n=2 Tax=Geobacillus TaxID=129337 RepID=A0ABN4NMW5_9BACL|nr:MULTISPECIES: FGGY family carbohydrate kinase [Geobacillus]AMX84246.1 hypothetical protein GS3922_11550 [Geobacillus subterraneus]KZS27163.1 hypothetical protein A5418_13065 [Geobacillus subterraneus]OXB88450.1 hypothetical protein B9L21_11425 [Geobacillus uzenensis]QIZ67118.1 hypothetical protein HF500_07615 [Geobacillus subterraneus]
MAKEYVIGLDLGTTSVKACVFHRSGQLMAEAEKMNTFHYPKQGWVEQDAAEIERSAVLAVREAIEQIKRFMNATSALSAIWRATFKRNR